jgi:hypothetical protein
MNPKSLGVRLALIAAELSLPGLPVVPDRVIDLAIDLLTAGKDTPGTVAVASLPAGTTLRDSEVLIRQMLAEQDVELPEPAETEAEQYAIALWAFGNGGLSVWEFSRRFYAQVPSWDHQSTRDRQLILLLDDWERADAAGRDEIEGVLRRLASAT